MSGSGPLQAGTIFARDFRINRALREGGMGAVYIVDQLSTGKQRALKVMAAYLASDPATRDRFVLEARAASAIESDHVVEIVTAGVDEESGSPYLVMELLRGEDLSEAVERTGKLALGDVDEILSQVGHALAQAHANGIVHRDLKPENIFLATSRRRDGSFTAKVLDFGIAKLVADSVQKTGTQPLGTPLFMSPEQTDRKGKIVPATDVWALGLIVFKLLTGKDFWLEAEGSLTTLLREVVLDPIPPATERAAALGVRELLPPGFDGFFARCVTRDTEARYPEAGAAVAAFNALVPPGTVKGLLKVSAPPSEASSLGIDTAALFPAGGRPSAFGATEAVSADALAATGAVSTGTNPNAPSVAASTTSPASLAQAPAAAASTQSGPKAWLLAIPVVLAAVAAGGYFLRPSGEAPASVTGASSATGSSLGGVAPPAASASASAGPKGCPEGMALINGGTTFVGARDLGDDAKPPHAVKVSSYCIDKREVSAGDYAACFEKGECERPLENVSWPDITPALKKRFSPLCNAMRPDRATHPVNCVAWGMADTYCKRRGGRLPTEAEWEFAARGSRQRTYPWGDEAPDNTRLNACGAECAKWGAANAQTMTKMYDQDDGFAATAPVGSFPAGATAEGVLDLAGNVWEWTADWHAPYPTGSETIVDPKGPAKGTERVVRGGDFFAPNKDWAKPAWRWETAPETYNHAIGFRCASDAK